VIRASSSLHFHNMSTPSKYSSDYSSDYTLVAESESGQSPDTADLRLTSTVAGPTSTVDGIWSTLHNYISDMPCPNAKRPKLHHLIDQTEKEWADILAGREESCSVKSKSTLRRYTAAKKTVQPPRKAAVMRAMPRVASQWVEGMQRGDRGQLPLFSTDLDTAFKMMNTTKLRNLNLQRDYAFISSIGTEYPFRAAIAAKIDISSKPVLEKLKFPGTRTIAVKVGYCHHFDMDVFFADNGGVYLVDTEQVRGPYEAEKKLDSDWREFSI
jgi:hypothetical protein